MNKTGLIMLLLAVFSVSHAGAERFQIPINGSPSYGPSDAPVTVVEFIDFQ